MQRVVLVCVLFLCLSVDAWSFSETNSTSIDKKSAYCYYYGSNDVDVSNQNTWINATSKSGNVYITIYASETESVTQLSTRLAICTPDQGNQHTCTTQTISWSYQEDVQLEYIMACIECHSLLSSCKVDSYTVALSQTPSEIGYIPCTACFI